MLRGIVGHKGKSKMPTIIDNGDFGYASSGFVGWSGQGYNNDLEYANKYPDDPIAESSWVFPVNSGQSYTVSVTYTEHENRATNAPFRIEDGINILWSGAVNQQQAPSDFTESGVGWKNLSTVTPGSDFLITLLQNDVANGYVIADAVRIA